MILRHQDDKILVKIAGLNMSAWKLTEHLRFSHIEI